MGTQYGLLKDRRFLPLFVTMFTGAFNDNLMKSFIVVMVAYGGWDVGSMKPEVLVSLAAALFILPFILFCPLAGQLTDLYDKSRVIRITKIAEILIACVAIAAIFLESTPLAFLMLFGLGTHSAFFSPGKFSILPQHLKQEELIAANGLVSTGTYLAILAGTIIGTFFAMKAGGPYVASGFLLAFACAGYVASRFIPPAPSKSPDVRLNFNPLMSAVSTIMGAWRQKHGVFLAILGISWFYFVAATVHTQFPNFARQTLGVDTNVLSVFMIVFSLGIAVGGMLNNRLLRSRVDPVFVPWSALAIAVLAFDLYAVSLGFSGAKDTEALMTFSTFFVLPEAWRIVADLFFLSFFGGLYVVPLRAIVQNRTPEGETARVMAANSLCDSLCILLSSLLAGFLLSLGWSVQEFFIVLSVLTAFVALYFLLKKPFRIDEIDNGMTQEGTNP